MHLKNTASMNDFDLIRTIGIGSFGRVVYSIHKRSKKSYAIKILKKDYVVRMQQVERVFFEKRILQSVESKFLVDLRFVFKTNSNLFLVMPFIKGGELYTYMKEGATFPESRIVFYAAQVILAFEYLHAMNIVYRDLKPENVLLDCNGYIRIVDYGFAKRIASNNNKTKSFVGTPEYMAPEMLIPKQRKKGYAYSVDWWSLGVFIYELKTGSPPFAGDNLFQVFNRIIKLKYKVLDDFDKGLVDLLNGIFQINPAIRLGSGAQGSEEFKGHAWFAKVNWSDLLTKKLEADFIPQCDDKMAEWYNFDEFEEEQIIENDKVEYAELFRDF